VITHIYLYTLIVFYIYLVTLYYLIYNLPLGFSISLQVVPTFMTTSSGQTLRCSYLVLFLQQFFLAVNL